MNSSFAVCFNSMFFSARRSSSIFAFPIWDGNSSYLYCSYLVAFLIIGLLSISIVRAEGDAAAGKAAWIKTCEHCHGSPQPYAKDAFSDYDTTVNKLSFYASDPAAITKVANEGFIIPEGNTNDKAAPGKSTNVPMGTWVGDAPNRLGIGTTPTQYAINFSAYFASLFSLPEAPTIGTVVAGNTQASVSFAAPKSDLTIMSYTVTSNPGGITAKGKNSPIIVQGLTNGTNYTFKVTATSNAGTGPSSASSNSITPLPTGVVFSVNSSPAIAKSANYAPTAIFAKAGNAQARVFFTSAAGLQNISSFTVNVFSGGAATGLTTTGTKSPIIVTGLTNGATYTFTVTAHNNAGESFTSAVSNTITPLSILGD